MKFSLEFLDSIEKYAKDDLLEFMVFTCENKEIPLFISKAILQTIEDIKAEQ